MFVWGCDTLEMYAPASEKALHRPSPIPFTGNTPRDFGACNKVLSNQKHQDSFLYSLVTHTERLEKKGFGDNPFILYVRSCSHEYSV